VWEGWKAGFLAFHAFHTLVISMACFGNAFHKVTITAKTRFGNRNHLSEMPTIRPSAPRSILDERIGDLY
jgi:hypothetical protein